jgi:RNA polymerase sigma factor (sigma-70 family)
MIDFAAMTDEDLLTSYYEEEDEKKANEAFAELDRRYRPRLILSLTVPGYNRRFIKLQRAPGLEQRGEELAAEALFRVADTKGRPSARWDRARLPTRRVGPWIYGILHNVVVSQLRRRRLDVTTETDYQHGGRLADAASALDATPADDAGPDAALEHRALLGAVRDCVAELPEELRAVCELLFEQGMKQTDAAAVLRMSAPTLTRRKQEACEQLRRCLARKGLGHEVLG